jgi:hypothetical protein
MLKMTSIICSVDLYSCKAPQQSLQVSSPVMVKAWLSLSAVSAKIHHRSGQMSSQFELNNSAVQAALTSWLGIVALPF